MYRAEARDKEMLQKIKAAQMDEQDAVMITKFVRILIGIFFFILKHNTIWAIQINYYHLAKTFSAKQWYFIDILKQQ